MEILLNYHYPGNVRELENILEHALIICQEETLRIRHLPEYLQAHRITGRLPARKRLQPMEDSQNSERDRIISLLQKHSWHRSQTARALGIDRTTLWRKIKKYGIVP